MDKKMLDIVLSTIVKCFEEKPYWREWLESKPTGRFTIEINLNQGGVRDKPIIIIRDGI